MIMNMSGGGPLQIDYGAETNGCPRILYDVTVNTTSASTYHQVTTTSNGSYRLSGTTALSGIIGIKTLTRVTDSNRVTGFSTFDYVSNTLPTMDDGTYKAIAYMVMMDSTTLSTSTNCIISINGSDYTPATTECTITISSGVPTISNYTLPSTLAFNTSYDSYCGFYIQSMIKIS